MGTSRLLMTRPLTSPPIRLPSQTSSCASADLTATPRPLDRPRLVISESRGISRLALSTLESFAEVDCLDADRPALLSHMASADLLWIRLRNRIDADVIDAAPTLQAIVSPTTGLNHVDLAAADAAGVTVLSLRGQTDFLKDIRATAELTLGLMLCLLRRLPAAARHVLAGGWNRDLFVGHELYGRTVGIVGYGRLGRIVARYLLGLDVRVLATDPHVAASEFASGVRRVDLNELLAEADLVSLHVNLTAETAGMFGRSELLQMRKGSWLVNTARGELLDEAALLDALQSGRLAGAALDVLCDEHDPQLASRPLVEYAREHEQLLLTPHLGGCTEESLHKTEEFMAQRLKEWWQATQGGAATT